MIGLTEPWHGRLNLGGVAFALVAALGWAAYILLTQRVGAQLSGLQGLALSLGTAAVGAAPAAAWPALHGLTPVLVVQGAGLAVLVPLLPFSLEPLALRRMRVAAFGTLMALEPGIAALIGLLFLAQRPAAWQVAGVILVIVAGVGAQRAAPAAGAAARPPAAVKPRRALVEPFLLIGRRHQPARSQPGIRGPCRCCAAAGRSGPKLYVRTSKARPRALIGVTVTSSPCTVTRRKL